MPYRTAVLSLVLSAFIAPTSPLQAQNSNGSGAVLTNMTGPGVSSDINASSAGELGSISGTVRTSDRHAAANARIEIHSISTGTMVATGYVNPNGTFMLKGLPNGTYEVVATAGLSEASEEVQVEGLETSVNLTLPHTNTTDPNGQKTVSVAQLKAPDKARHELDKARQALSKSEMEEARKHIGKALAIDPQYADALVLLGAIELQESNMGAASQDFNQALQYDDSAAMAYIGTGAVYNMQGRFDDALRVLDRGAALDPTAWQAQFEMARANLGKGNFEGALRCAGKAQQLQSNDFTPIHLVKGHALLGMKDYSAAVAEFEAFLSKDSQSPDAPQARQQLEEAKAFVATARK